MRAKSEGALSAEIPPSVERVLGSPGSPLDTRCKNAMEGRFRADFNAVRVHTDTLAADSVHDVQARAYTVGKDVVFGAGEYRPGTTAGEKLIAHELAHVIQQGHAPPLVGHPVDGPNVAPLAVQRSTHSDRLQRACGTAIGSPAGCTGVEGDIVGEHYLFLVNCDDLKPGEEARLRAFAGTLSSGGSVDIHGFASIEGLPSYNDDLSCARAIKVQSIVDSVLTPRGISVKYKLYQHGATAGNRAERRSAAIDWLPAGPAPAPPAAPGCTAPTNPDMSGRAFNPTTDSQNAVALRHPLDAITANNLATDALAAAQASGLPGLHLGQADSFRHCLWSCRMAQDLGPVRAEEFGTAHENSGPSAIPFDNQMDLHDNAVGRSLATPGATCDAACRGALTAGLLRTIRGPDADVAATAEGLTPPTPPVTPACIGASSQPWP